jgi:hypothetical protein
MDEQELRLAALNAAALFWSGKGGNARQMLEEADEILAWLKGES